MDVALWVAAYEKRQPFFAGYAELLERLLKGVFAAKKIDAFFQHRAKGVPAFAEKIGRTGKAYMDPLHEMTDLAAVRVICYDNQIVDTVCDLVRSDCNFHIDQVHSVDKRRTLDADKFGYASVHLIVKPNVDRAAMTEWRQFDGFPAEIQVRTVLAHAWATLSHKTWYKRESEVPIDLTRRLSRLAALLEIADEQVVHLNRDHEALRANVRQRIGELDLRMELNLLTLRAYLETAPIIGRILELTQASSQLSTTGTLAQESPTQLLQVLTGLRVLTVAQLDGELKDVLAMQMQVSKFLSHDAIRRFAADRTHAVLLLILLKRFDELERSWLQARLNWEADFIDSIAVAVRASG